MSDLISRQDAVALVIKAIHGTDNKEIQEYLFDGLRKQMWSLPSAEPVVRCSECKYVGYDATTFPVCDRKGMGLKPFHVYHDDYCSYGERREDGEV